MASDEAADTAAAEVPEEKPQNAAPETSTAASPDSKGTGSPVMQSPYNFKSKVNPIERNLLAGMGKMLLDLIQSNDFTRAQGMVMGGVELNSETDRFGCTALHHAVSRGPAGLTRMLLQHKADANAADGRLQTALHIASRRGDVLVLKQLLEHQASANAVSVEGDSPLSIAAGRGGLEFVKLLLGGKAQPNIVEAVRSKQIEVPFSEVAEGSGPDQLRLFLNRYNGSQADFIVVQPTHPLLKAVKRNSRPEVITALLDAKAHPDPIDMRSNCALHVASYHGSTASVRALLKSGSNPNFRNYAQRTAMHFAARAGNARIVKLLADSKGEIGAEDQDGLTPIHVAGDALTRNTLVRLGANEHGGSNNGVGRPDANVAISPPMSPKTGSRNRQGKQHSDDEGGIKGSSREQSPDRSASPMRNLVPKKVEPHLSA